MDTWGGDHSEKRHEKAIFRNFLMRNLIQKLEPKRIVVHRRCSLLRRGIVYHGTRFKKIPFMSIKDDLNSRKETERDLAAMSLDLITKTVRCPASQAFQEES